MKKICLFMAFCGILSTAQAQIIYVKASALGAATGTSWNDAFLTLDAALLAAVPGTQIWVSAGTYKPTITTIPNKSFAVLAGTELYGGFAGTESSLADRNYLVNVTTLSGDISGNDVGFDSLSRVDNSWHVLMITNGNPALRAVVDGFVIRNGNTKIATADPDGTKRGGGIFANAKVTVRNCLFTENAGLLGGGISALGSAGSAIIVDNCIFENNKSNNSSAGIYLASSTGALINRCTFRNNTTNRGCLYPNQCSNVVIDSCLFENNFAAPNNWGGALYNWQSSYVLTNSTFKNNLAHNAGGIYNDGRDGNDSFVIDNCVFEENKSSNYGGSAMFNFNANYEIKNCTFLNNTAPTSAAAIYLGGSTAPNASIKNCIFDGGATNFGGAVANYSSPGTVTIEGSIFQNNTATTSGGAMTNGFLAQTAVKNCIFEANTARFGGAIFLQNDSTSLFVDSTLFSGNNANDIGGAVYCSSGNTSSFTNCFFTVNSSENGAALVISEDSLDLGTSVITNCVFQENFGLTQAGALNVENADVTMTNTLFSGNQVLGAGAGGAVLVNGFGKKTAHLTAVNCTWGANVGSLGGGLAAFEGDSGKAVINLQNCIFGDLVDSWAIEAGEPVVNSLGGNLCMDASLSAYLQATNDLNGVDPLFVEPNSFDFHLSPGSPCIDKGIAAGAPTMDLDGHPRLGAPDMGSYEWGTTSTHLPTLRLPLQLLPNPALDVVRANIENSYNGQVDVQIVDASGRVARHLIFDKTGSELSLELRVSDLPKGPYTVQVQMGNVRMSGGLMRM